eukprot:364568-Chlamydomonas_euryale.AAC.16
MCGAVCNKCTCYSDALPERRRLRRPSILSAMEAACCTWSCGHAHSCSACSSCSGCKPAIAELHWHAAVELHPAGCEQHSAWVVRRSRPPEDPRPRRRGCTIEQWKMLEGADDVHCPICVELYLPHACKRYGIKMALTWQVMLLTA